MMARRKFIACLNRQKKIWNYSFGCLVGAVVMGTIFGLLMGILWGFGAAGVGFAIGGWIDNSVYLGKLQRLMYWVMPYSGEWLSKNIPESSQRYEL